MSRVPLQKIYGYILLGESVGEEKEIKVVVCGVVAMHAKG